MTASAPRCVHYAVIDREQWSPRCRPSYRWTVPLARDFAQVTCTDCVETGGPMRVRAYHPASGSILIGEVTDVLFEGRTRSLRVIPDGLLESVVIREGVWVVDDA